MTHPPGVRPTAPQVEEHASRPLEQDAFYRTLLDRTGDGVLVFDPMPGGWFAIVDANEAALRVHGYTREELIGQPLSLLDPFTAGESKVAIDAGQWVVFDARHVRKDGSVFDLEVRASFATLGSRTYLVSIERDITARKQAEQRLRESESELMRSQAIAHVGHWVRDVASKTVRCSPEMLRIFGVDEGADPGTFDGRLHDAVHPEDLERITRAMRGLLTDEHPQPMEFRIVRPGGAIRYLLAVPGDQERDETGRVVRHSGVIQDLTELRQLEERRKTLEGQLQQAMKMEAVGRLAGGIAHDFNNLLTSISGNVDLALLDLMPDSPLAGTLRHIGQAADSAATLTRQLLAFSRKQMIEPRLVDLNDLIANLHKMLVRVIGEDVALRTVQGQGLGAVLIDPGQFEQVLVNLAVNARDAMPDGGHLVIETANVQLDEAYCATHAQAQPGPFVRLAVSDTGVGMDARVKEHLFEPFFTTKPTGRGTGLGLATIFGTVQQAGGFIEVYSEPGTGTSFKIYLPRAEGQATRLQPGVKGEMKGGTELVLLVEDEASVRDLVIRILTRLGYRVLPASNGAEALNLAQRHEGPLDLLMTDVVMPGMNGRELAERLTLLHPEVRVLYSSGYTENVIVHHGVVDPQLNFISKPYSPHALAAKIRDVLDAR